jgi:RimJ/RimL family protein N-acetyltransferase
VAVKVMMRSPRLVLREVVEEDVDAIHEYASDPQVLRHLPLPLSSRDQTAAAVRTMIASAQEIPRSRVALAIVPADADRPVGTVILRISSHEHREGHLAVCLRRSSWGRGYASEACAMVLQLGFETLDLHRIQTWVSVSNVASLRLMDKLGMRNEGRLVEHLKIDGKWVDSFVFALLQSEWHCARMPERPRSSPVGSDA